MQQWVTVICEEAPSVEARAALLRNPRVRGTRFAPQPGGCVVVDVQIRGDLSPRQAVAVLLPYLDMYGTEPP